MQKSKGKKIRFAYFSVFSAYLSTSTNIFKSILLRNAHVTTFFRATSLGNKFRVQYFAIILTYCKLFM